MLKESRDDDDTMIIITNVVVWCEVSAMKGMYDQRVNRYMMEMRLIVTAARCDGSENICVKQERGTRSV